MGRPFFRLVFPIGGITAFPDLETPTDLYSTIKKAEWEKSI